MPLLQQLLAIAAQFGAKEFKEIEADLLSLGETALKIILAYATGDMTSEEAKSAFAILVNTMQAQADTVLIKIKVEAERLPSEVMDGVTSVFTSLPGELLKLI